MTADLTRRLSSLDFLDEDEHEELFGWGHRAVLMRPVVESSVPVLFGAQVQRAADAVAVCFEGVSLSYR
ncbi:MULTISPECIES: hypothetical protein, partial [Mycobacterium]|uniref:hypothetical protein n=1 Tax=Mycobacterium TaxID=1763 RepID=UPI0010425536